MDFSKFKKVSSDHKCTTLMHEGGHVLKIAHNGLSKEMLSDLQNLPMHKSDGGDVKVLVGSKDPLYATLPKEQAEKRGKIIAKENIEKNRKINPKLKGLAEGGEVKHYAEGTGDAGEDDSSQDQSNSPVTINIGGPQPQQQMPVTGLSKNGTPNALLPSQPQQAPQQNAQMPAQSQAAIQEPPSEQIAPPDVEQEEKDQSRDEADQSFGVAQGPQTLQEYQRQNHQDLMMEDQNFANDLTNGHITPKTYSDLMGNTTLGKVGSIFGLMLAGAGSGLTHQPNALLEMMNNQIKNDLEAQVKSKENAQNLYRLNLQHQIQLAQIEQMKKQGHLTEEQANLAEKEAQTKAFALTNMQMNRTALHSLAQQVEKMPPGTPERALAEQKLAMISQGVQSENYNISDRAAAASAYMKTLLGNPSGQNSEESFQKQNKAKMLLGPQGAEVSKYESARHLPGVPEIDGQQASREIPEDTRKKITAMQTLSDKAQDLLDYAKAHKGSIDPKTLTVGSQKAEEMMNFYNDSIGQGVLTKGRMEWLDKQIKKNPTSVFQDILGNNAQLQEIKNSNDTRKGTILKSLGFTPKAQEQQESQDTIERMDPTSGKIVVFDAKTKKPLRWK